MTLCFTQRIKNGPGTPLVFLHGFLGNSLDWERVCAFLPPCCCIGVDLPGHGRSLFSETFDFAPPAPKFHLIGYSMGGRLAMQYALTHPNRIAGLAITSAHPGLEREKEKQKRLQTDAEWARLIHQLPIDEFLKRWYDQPLFANHKPDFSMRRKQNIPGLSAALMHYSLGRQPILCVNKAVHIAGEHDAKFRALHPHALIVLNAGHAAHLDNPEAFAQIIEEAIL